jgi:photosystem II stability/assembly factor-like uncharacterized protein
MSRAKHSVLTQATVALVCLLGVSARAGAASVELSSGMLAGLNARNIGSATMSGRIAAVVGRQETDGRVSLYIGAASGGVWRSQDGGTTFKPIFDKQPVQSIGALALDPNDPKTLWVGTGESWMRNSVSIGNGVYVSHDAGESFEYKGLPHSEHIARVVVDPRDSKVVYACVTGAAFNDSPERGLYKTSDGGEHWSLILAGNNLSTGCSSVALDPADPKHLLVGMWDFRRQAFSFRSGGNGPKAVSQSGLYESSDAGGHFTAKTAATAAGLPTGPWGRVEVTFAPSDAKVVYALIENVRTALYRSDDGGKTFSERDRSQLMVWRPFYFSRLVVDPHNPERLFKPDLQLIVSDDGGKSFANTNGGSHGDHHDLWINPNNPKMVVSGDDGGLWISHDGGSRWNKSFNLPISQFYHVAVDQQDPVQVYGGLQDNSAWVGDSEYPGGISNSRWENLFGGDGFYVLPDPTDSHYVYAESQGGFIGRVNRHTLAARSIQPLAKAHEKLRFNWNTPMALSAQHPERLYLGAQFLFRTTDHGQSWQRLSGDLSTNDPTKQLQEQSGGITVDNSAAEMHTTIVSIGESPLNDREIWVGTDDGNLQLTRDDGAHWVNLIKAVPKLGANAWVTSVSPSAHSPGLAWVSFDRHTQGDMAAYVYKTLDHGQHFTRLDVDGQIQGYVHVIKEDPKNPAIVYVGSELGLWISLDQGAHFVRFTGGQLPPVAVRDLAFDNAHENLVIATHGRGMWIIDDLSPLRALTQADLTKPVVFLASRPIEQRIEGSGGWPEGDATFVGQNPAAGALISYYQKTRHVFGRLSLAVLDANGQTVATLTPGKAKGINRVVWSMQTDPPRVPTAAQAAGAGSQGPRVLPGTYTVKLSANGVDYTQTLTVGLDKRADYSVADRQVQFEQAMRVHRLFGRMSDDVERLNGLKELLRQKRQSATVTPAVDEALEAFEAQLESIRKQVVATTEGGAITGEERLREHLDRVYGAILAYDGKPTEDQLARVVALTQELSEVEQHITTLMGAPLNTLNQKLLKAKVSPITLADAARVGATQATLQAWERLLHPSEVAVATERD